ncbi:hypothetical protein N656DRAFT_794755 [Canariomyces notabilis]|uniref:Uncharacterized protein n=1 Tax=Canariomyces notabilis TaxID=2074819 RepID=A0AAN6TLV0_9PEZI|nr:hypothetical protein N656DRAFT_794755 [Canariomyces arenarius]
MDSSAVLLSRPAPDRPGLPLALAQFIAQTSCSGYTNFHDEPLSKPGVEDSIRAVEQDTPRTESPQRPPQREQTPTTDREQDAPPVDWLATRYQLLPRRNQGRKADWICAWSEAVSAHGETTYCACSEPVDGDTVSKKRSSGLAGNVKAILQVKSHGDKPAADLEQDICEHCCRPAPPPGGNPASSVGERLRLPRGRSFTRKMSSLLERLKARQSRHGRGPSAEVGNQTWPKDYQPEWATVQRRALVKPPSPTVEKSRSMDIFPLFNRPRIATPSSESTGLSDSDMPRATEGLSRSMSRLKRAAALLQRTSKPHLAK